MSNYSYSRAPATTSLIAGFAFMGVSLATGGVMENSMERIQGIYGAALSSGTGFYVQRAASTTANLNYSVPGKAVGEALLRETSQAFALTLSQDAQMIGREFLEVAEENFWDLVLR